MFEGGEPAFVLDTHALYWYWTAPERLGPAADEAFRALERHEVVGLVPILVVAEMHYLTAKKGWPLPVAEILRLVDRSPALRLEGMTRQHLLAFGRLDDIPEMHDRFIAAVGVINEAPVVTRDPLLRAHRAVRTVW